MNDDRERIIEFDAATSIPADGWLAIDSSTEGTKKVQKSAIIGSGQLDTTSQEVIGAINEVNARAATVVSMTQAEYDALPDTKLSDNIVRFITDGVPTVDQTLWNKVGTSTLNTTAQNCSDAINELKSNLSESVTMTLEEPTGKITSIGGRADRFGKFVNLSIDLTMNAPETSGYIVIGNISPKPLKVIKEIVLSDTTFTNAKQLRFYINNSTGNMSVFYGGAADFHINIVFAVS